jgi:hypothetical protein
VTTSARSCGRISASIRTRTSRSSVSCGKVLTQGSSRRISTGSSSCSIPTASTRLLRRRDHSRHAWSPRLVKTESELAGVLGTRSLMSPRTHGSGDSKERVVSLTAQEVGGSAGLSDSVVSKTRRCGIQDRHQQRLRFATTKWRRIA